MYNIKIDSLKNLCGLLITSFILVTIYFFVVNSQDVPQFLSKSSLSVIKPLSIMLFCITFFICLYIVSLLFNDQIKKRNFVFLSLLFSWTSLAIILAYKLKQVDNFITLLILLCIVTFIVINEAKKSIKLNYLNKNYVYLLWSATIIYIVIFACYTSIKYISYNSGALDLGLTAQLFYNMTENGAQVSTLEPIKGFIYANHYALHISPILHLVSIGYFFIKSPVYILVIQTILLGSGVIPLYKLSLKLLNNNFVACLISIAYLLHPGIHGANLFDFHEVSIAAPLILWLLYLMECEKWKLFFITFILSILVKEDIPIVTSFIAILMAYRKGKMKLGIYYFCSSFIYFVLCTKYLIPFFGGEPLYSRYDSLLKDPNEGFVGIIKTILINPIYVLTQIIKIDKIIFLLQLLVPLLFVPLLTGLSSLILFVPIILTHLISSFDFQYDIDFHYPVVSTSLLFYLLVIAFSKVELLKKQMNFIACLILCCSLIFGVGFTNMSISNIEKYLTSETTDVKSALNLIPEDASVSASNLFVPHLANRHEIYLFPKINDSDYIVVDLSKNDSATYPIKRGQYHLEIQKILDGKSYGVVFKNTNVLILKRGIDVQKNKIVKDELYTFLPNNMHSNVNKDQISKDKISVNFRNKNYVVYGPFIDLDKGKYQIEITLKEFENVEDLKNIKFDISSNNGRKILSNSDGFKVENNNNVITASTLLDLKTLEHDLEFRVFSNGGATFSFEKVTVQPIN